MVGRSRGVETREETNVVAGTEVAHSRFSAHDDLPRVFLAVHSGLARRERNVAVLDHVLKMAVTRAECRSECAWLPSRKGR